MLKKDQHIGGYGGERLIEPAIAAEKKRRFAGVAAAVFTFVKHACMQTFGACPVITSPGNVRIAVPRMDSATSNSYNFLSIMKKVSLKWEIQFLVPFFPRVSRFYIIHRKYSVFIFNHLPVRFLN